uniref:Uncharacterized protein n=1 Tax=Pelusios castaneus TaxID=367368 RepID=A0A8C8VIF1_9SAUR
MSVSNCWPSCERGHCSGGQMQSSKFDICWCYIYVLLGCSSLLGVVLPLVEAVRYGRLGLAAFRRRLGEIAAERQSAAKSTEEPRHHGKDRRAVRGCDSVWNGRTCDMMNYCQQHHNKARVNVFATIKS